jgi:hypothetical protein
VILGLAVAVAACSPLRSTPATRYQGMLLNARDLGADALRLEMERDPTVRQYVAGAGRPDFIVIGGLYDVELVYVPPSRLVHFHRAPDAATTVHEVTPIPTGLLQILPRDLRAGTPWPLNPGQYTTCWTVDVRAGSCRTCCATLTSCVTECRQEVSTATPRQKAMWPRMSFAASFVSG